MDVTNPLLPKRRLKRIFKPTKARQDEPRPCIYGCDLRTVHTSEWQLQKHINIAHSGYQPTRCRYPGCKSTQLIETEVSYKGHLKKIHQLRGDQQELYTVGLRNKGLPTLEKLQDHRRGLTRRCIALCMPWTDAKLHNSQRSSPSARSHDNSAWHEHRRHWFVAALISDWSTSRRAPQRAYYT
jgi:hypothetical protein